MVTGVMEVMTRVFMLAFIPGILIVCTLADRPNFVVLLVDDLGIGDIGCFGNDTIKTPNVDSLAARGVKLSHNLAPESMCTPSRAATLTGRYAVRSGLAAGPEESRVFWPLAKSGGLPRNETTFAEILQDYGYRTGRSFILAVYLLKMISFGLGRFLCLYILHIFCCI